MRNQAQKVLFSFPNKEEKKEKTSTKKNARRTGYGECECCGTEIGVGWDYYELPDGTLICDECMVWYMMKQYRKCCGEEQENDNYGF